MHRTRLEPRAEQKKQETSGARATRILAHRCTQEAEQEEKNEIKTVSSLVEDFAIVALQSDDGRVETELVRFLERFANRRAARTSVASFAGFRMNYRGINVARTSNAPPSYDLRRTIPFSDLAGFPSLHSGLENRISQPKSYFFNFNVSQKLFFYGLTTLFLLSNNSVVNKLIIIKSTDFTLFILPFLFVKKCFTRNSTKTHSPNRYSVFLARSRYLKQRNAYSTTMDMM